MEHITLKIDFGLVAFLVLGALAAAVPVVLAAFLAVFLAADFFAVFGFLTAGFLAAFASSSCSHYPPEAHLGPLTAIFFLFHKKWNIKHYNLFWLCHLLGLGSLSSSSASCTCSLLGSFLSCRLKTAKKAASMTGTASAKAPKTKKAMKPK